MCRLLMQPGDMHAVSAECFVKGQLLLKHPYSVDMLFKTTRMEW